MKLQLWNLIVIRRDLKVIKRIGDNKVVTMDNNKDFDKIELFIQNQNCFYIVYMEPTDI